MSTPKKTLVTTLASCAAALGLAAAAHAAPVSVIVDSVVHGAEPLVGGTPLNTGALNTGLQVNSGDTVTISTDANDRWNINGFAVNATGFPSAFGGSHNFLTGMGGKTAVGNIDYGALAWSLDNVNFQAAYNVSTLSTTISFVAQTSGLLRLAMWDTIVSDNGGNSIGSPGNTLSVNVDIVPGSPSGNSVPEPASLALAGLALASLGLARRRPRG